jgi:tryptophan synthase beta chain
MFAYLNKTKRVIFHHATDDQALDAAFKLTTMEGIIPALESAHAVALLDKMSFRPNDVVVVIISGRGDKDMAAYMTYMEKMNNKKI